VYLRGIGYILRSLEDFYHFCQQVTPAKQAKHLRELGIKAGFLTEKTESSMFWAQDWSLAPEGSLYHLRLES
jgi:hypothetical protein